MMKVAIVGTAPGSRLLAPFHDPSWEIWACSAGNSQGAALPRVNRWFEMHGLAEMTAEENRPWSLPYFQWLRQQQFAVYLQERTDLVPQGIVFPMREIIKRFGKTWFTSSIAWMMAFAVMQMREGDEIAIFGVDMAADQEHYTSQKAGCLRWIEIAKEHKITVSVPNESCLGKEFPLYGYSEATPFGRKLAVRKKQLEDEKKKLDAQIRHCELMRSFYEGSLEDVNYMMRTWTDGEEVQLDLGIEAKPQPNLDTLPLAVPLEENFTKLGSGLLVPKNEHINGSGGVEERSE